MASYRGQQQADAMVSSTSSSSTSSSSKAIQWAPASIVVKREDGMPNPTVDSSTQHNESTETQQDPNFTAADSNSGSAAKQFVACKVCGDKASGYHYGVTSCEGCKGFFRRSIQKQIEYRCLRDGGCMIIRLNRNRCQHCRFKKCLAVGMSRDSVRYGRVPKRSREKVAEETKVVVVSEADQSAWDSNWEVQEKQLIDLSLRVNEIHNLHCGYTEEKIKEIIKKPAIFNVDTFQTMTIDANGNTHIMADSLEQQKIIMWEYFATMLTPYIQRVVEIAKKFPGFLLLGQGEQIILIKDGFFEIWLIHISRVVNSSDNTLTLTDGSYLTRQQLEFMFDYEFVASLFNFAASLNSLQLCDIEIALLSLAVLYTPDRPLASTNDSKVIAKHQEKLLDALKYQLAQNHPENPHIFPTLMLKLTELRSIGTKHSDHLEWYRMNWMQLNIPPLFAETFEIRSNRPPEETNTCEMDCGN